MINSAIDQILKNLPGVAPGREGGFSIFDEKALAGRMDGIVREAVFGDGEAKAAARWLIWETAQELGIRPASIHDFYLARGRGEVAKPHTVPAINLRMMTYDSARAVFRAARARDVGALIFEIARSEIGYTDQRPAEYAAAVLAAAIREGFRGPLFLQGDHFQVSAKKYAAAPEAEVTAVRDLVEEALAAGFCNIDIDTSTLVDLSKATLDEQQRLNYELCADFARFIREREPKGVTISIGGEIGEVGQKNSTPEDLDVFMRGFDARRGALVGISKISIQTGTSHGGVVLPDGTLADVAIDFEVLRALSDKARKDHGMGGAVQHGASTLPDTAFHKFVEAGTCEVHLATAFQNLIMDHPLVPEELRGGVVDWVKTNAADERKAKDTEAQFIYKSRKKAVGPFKKDFWDLPEEARAAIGADLEKQFGFLFDQLGVGGTAELVKTFVEAPVIHRPRPAGGGEKAGPGGKPEDVSGLAD
ncbi:MAG: class II fructose-bisphosphate aldolase [Candidatus Aminicenantes bacterium]|nr:class II fructose-bisphosphate aldolase [Candidatus Aminicenantes bacterium]